MPGLHQHLDPSMLAVTAPPGSKEGDPWFVLAMSMLGLVGIAVQPHTMTATGSGKTETEARVGMCYGNFIKRFLTIAWAFTGLIAAVQFPEVLHGLQGEPARDASETLFGRSIQVSLGDGWRGLMIACLIAGVTSAETFMVVGASLFTRNFYEHVAKGRSDRHYLWVGRAASVAMLGLGITVAFFAGSVTQILLSAIQLIGLLGAGFWLGVVWRRANAAGVWAGFLGGFLVWAATSFNPELAQGIPLLGPAATAFVEAAKGVGLRDIYPPIQVLMMLAAEFGLLILVSAVTKPHPTAQLDAFYARLHTPVGREEEMLLDHPTDNPPESATLGMEGKLLDYRKASMLAYPGLRKLGVEIPRMGPVDWGGFLAAWVLVGLLIVLLIWLAGIGAG
jgi:Na+/proline symporter